MLTWSRSISFRPGGRGFLPCGPALILLRSKGRFFLFFSAAPGCRVRLRRWRCRRFFWSLRPGFLLLLAHPALLWSNLSGEVVDRVLIGVGRVDDGLLGDDVDDGLVKLVAPLSCLHGAGAI